MKAAGVQEPQDCDLPQCLEEIIGSTLTFQLNLPHFNFTAKHQSFTASCILDHNQRPPQRNFEVHVSSLEMYRSMKFYFLGYSYHEIH